MAKNSSPASEAPASGLTISFGEHSFVVSTLPAVSIQALLQSGLNHKMGNEISSKVVSAIRAHIVSGTDRKVTSVTLEEVKAFRAEHEDEVNEIQGRFESEYAERLRTGNLTVERAQRGSVSKVEARARQLAWTSPVDGLPSLRAILDANNIKAPKRDETVSIGGVAYTKDALIDKRLERAGDSLRRMAEAELAAEAKAKAERDALNKASAEGGADLI